MFVWGLGTSGQLGCGRIADTLREPCISPLMTSQFVIAAAAGEAHTLLLTSAGEVWSSGQGISGALGHGSFYELLHQFCRIEALKGVFVTAVATTAKTSFALTKQGTLLSFGT